MKNVKELKGINIGNQAKMIVDEIMGISMNTREEELKMAKILLKEYQAKKDKVNIAICLRNIKNFSKK